MKKVLLLGIATGIDGGNISDGDEEYLDRVLDYLTNETLLGEVYDEIVVVPDLQSASSFDIPEHD